MLLKCTEIVLLRILDVMPTVVQFTERIVSKNGISDDNEKNVVKKFGKIPPESREKSSYDT